MQAPGKIAEEALVEINYGLSSQITSDPRIEQVSLLNTTFFFVYMDPCTGGNWMLYKT